MRTTVSPRSPSWKIIAAGSINADGTTAWCKGCKVIDTGTGVKTVRLDRPAAASECSVTFGIRGTTSGNVRCEQTSAQDKTIKSFAVDGTTPADIAVDFTVVRK